MLNKRDCIFVHCKLVSESGESGSELIDVFLIQKKGWLDCNTIAFVELYKDTLFKKMALKSLGVLSILSVNVEASTETSNTSNSSLL